MQENPSPLDQRLLSVLVCPVTKGPLLYDRENNELISCQGALAYPIRDGIPVMLANEARSLTDEEISNYKKSL